VIGGFASNTGAPWHVQRQGFDIVWLLRSRWRRWMTSGNAIRQCEAFSYIPAES
jgi:hypothetical protein